MVSCDKNINKQYISDVITKEDIESWSNKEIVFIEAPTGSGKSHFIKHTLSEYNSFKRFLILVNRRIIKNQSEEELIKEYGDCENIKIVTYQYINNKILEQDIIKLEELSNYDYIICDEGHFYCEESVYVTNSDLVFDWVMKRDSIKIFMTATAYFIKSYLQEKLKLRIKHYQIKNTYDFIQKLYFYEDDKVIQKLLIDLPPNEKAIYFTSAKKAHELSEILDSCAFYCAENNSQYYQYVNEDTVKCIENNEMFEEKILCCTKVMDTGVNIKDKQLKHLIIDIADITSIIQCIGRKRILDIDDNVIVYIKNKKGNSMIRKLEQVEDKLYYPNVLKENGLISLVQNNAHKNTYGNLIYDIINYKTQQVEKRINPLMYYTYNILKEEYEEMLIDKENGFKNKLFERMGVDDMEYSFLEDEVDGIKLEDLLNRLVGIKMFKEEQEKFKEILLKELLNAPKANHGSVGLKTINALFDENNMDYVIKSFKETKGQYRNKMYWIIGNVNFNN